MRLVTRSDFDGLVCGALLLEAGVIDSWKFAHYGGRTGRSCGVRQC